MEYSHLKRNLYFKGKLLKAKDFEEEQTYFIQRLRSLGTLFAPGIIKGLRVLDKKEGKIVVEKGYAINEEGKLLHVDNEIEAFVNEVQGFEFINNNVVDLFLISKETPIEPILSQQQDKEEIFSKMEESFTLSLTPHQENFAKRRRFYDVTLLYEDQDIAILQNIPRYINNNGSFFLSIEVFKKVHKDIIYGLEYELECSSLYMEEGAIKISIRSHPLQTRKETLYFRLYHDEKQEQERALINIKEEEIVVIKEEERKKLAMKYNQIFPIVEDIETTIKEECRSCLFESKEKIYLATITLCFHKENTIRIENIENVKTHEYTSIPYLESYKSSIINQMGYTEKPYRCKETTNICGKILLNDLKKSNNDVYCSSQIEIKEQGYWYLDIHPVFKETKVLQPSEFVLYGNGLFYDKQTSMYEKIQKAIHYDFKKNRFEVAIKIPPILLKQIQYIQWTGIKIHKIIAHENLKIVSLTPSFVTLKPKENCLFTPVFNKEGKLSCYYEVDENEGSIDEYGMYIAPEKEGIYKIRASDEKGNHAETFVHVKGSDSHVCH